MKSVNQSRDQLYFKPLKEHLVEENKNGVFQPIAHAFQASWLKVLAAEMFAWLLIYIGVFSLFLLIRYINSL